MERNARDFHHRRGTEMAAVLAGCWRTPVAPLTVSGKTLARLVSPFLEGGTAALAWCRLGSAALRPDGPARSLRDAYRLQVCHAVNYRERLQEIVTRLRQEHVEPILVKGWSIARLYGATDSRPCGDIDLCVTPESVADAVRILSDGELGRDVDLHAGLADLEDRGWDEVTRRSRLVPLGGASIRVLGPEDQLRHLCLHLMRHGAFRPLWLCDVAAALEGLPPDFDADYCLSGRASLTDWVLCTMSLAQRLLDARVPPSLAGRLRQAPSWVESTVLRLWGMGVRGSDVVSTPLTGYPRTWAGLRQALRDRWPNPVRAAFKLRLSPYTRLPLGPIQIAAFFHRAGQYVVSKFQPNNMDEPTHLFDIHPAQIR